MGRPSENRPDGAVERSACAKAKDYRRLGYDAAIQEQRNCPPLCTHQPFVSYFLKPMVCAFFRQTGQPSKKDRPVTGFEIVTTVARTAEWHHADQSSNQPHAEPTTASAPQHDRGIGPLMIRRGVCCVARSGRRGVALLDRKGRADRLNHLTGVARRLTDGPHDGPVRVAPPGWSYATR